MKLTPRAVLGGAALFLGTQLWHTIRNRNRWPFCSYNMFNYTLPDEWEQARIVLYDQDGRALGPLDPWPLLPVEFFRVVSIIDLVFIGNEDERLREQFCARALAYMNTHPWRDFDEVRGAARPLPGGVFSAVELFLVQVDQVRCDPSDRASVRSATRLHRHDPLGVIRDQEPMWSFAEERTNA